MPPRQQPWATGQHKPGRKPPKTAAQKIWASAGRSYVRATRKHPWIALLLQVALGLAAVVCLVLGTVLESVLYYLVMAVAGLGALAVRRQQQMQRDRQQAAQQPRPRPTSAGPRTPPPPASEAPPPPAGGLKCTATGRPLDGADPCDCKSRHVRKESNAARRGVPLGTPYGKPK